MGNGAKAQQKRERNNADKPKAGSQLKANAKAMTIQCNVCKQTFMNTTKTPQLKEHLDSKHAGKATFEGCFPGIAAA